MNYSLRRTPLQENFREGGEIIFKDYIRDILVSLKDSLVTLYNLREKNIYIDFILKKKQPTQTPVRKCLLYGDNLHLLQILSK